MVNRMFTFGPFLPHPLRAWFPLLLLSGYKFTTFFRLTSSKFILPLPYSSNIIHIHPNPLYPPILFAFLPFYLFTLNSTPATLLY